MPICSHPVKRRWQISWTWNEHRKELDYLIYNDPVAHAELVLNGDPEMYLKTATEYKPLDS